MNIFCGVYEEEETSLVRRRVCDKMLNYSAEDLLPGQHMMISGRTKCNQHDGKTATVNSRGEKKGRKHN